MKTSLTGIKTTGELHIGNYLGAIVPAIEKQKDNNCIFMIADLHSITTLKDPKLLQTYIYDNIASWITLGVNTDQHTLFLQSQIPYHTELSWYFSCMTGMGFLERAHAYKDLKDKNPKDLNHGIFYYPILMATDILLYNTDLVPVGKDQKQHVEMTRDIANSFNNLYNSEIFKLPEAIIKKEIEIIPGLDDQKMSKRYNNVIPLWSTEKKLRKKIMTIKTDSKTLEEPKSLKGTLIEKYLTHFSTKEEYNNLEKQLQAGGLGWGHAKEKLFEIINNHFKDYRNKYQELRKDEEQLRKILKNGNQKALDISTPVIQRVRKAVGTNFKFD